MKERIEQYVEDNRDNMLEDIYRLVRIPSLKDAPQLGMPFGEGPDKALQEALEIAREKGFTVKNHDGYVGTVDFSDKEPGLDILAHLDVVPAPAEDWTVTSPFEPIEKDGKIYGRGTSDDKGPAICGLYAMKLVKDLDIPLNKNVRLILGTDEESGSSDIAYYYKNNDPAPATFSPDADFPVINVEKGRLNAAITASYDKPEGSHIVHLDCGIRPNVVPDQAVATVSGLAKADILSVAESWQKDTNLKIEVKENEGNLDIVVRGVGGHAAYPESANNALTGLVALLAQLSFDSSRQFDAIKGLSQMFPHGDWKGSAAGIAMEDDVSEHLTICLNILKVTPTELRGEFDSRTPIVSNKENTADVLEKNLKDKGLALDVISTDVPHHVPVDSPFVQTLLKAYEEYSGKEGYGTVTGGGTYVHGLENAVAFGPTLPGTETNIHGADEFAVVDQLLLATKIFAQVIIDVCG